MTAEPRLGTLFTTGARTGRPRGVTLGYVPVEAGELLVMALGPRGWTHNLQAMPDCEFARGEDRRAYRAARLRGAGARTAHRLYEERDPMFEGRMEGPVFRLTPVDGPRVP